MKTTLIVVLVVVVLLIAGGLYFASQANVLGPGTTTNTNPSTSQQTITDTNTQTTIPTTPATTPTMYNIAISNFAFSPSALTVKKGDTVTWTNQDSASHTVTSDSGSELSSSTLPQGGTYSHTFTVAGTYNYHCSIHTMMKGTIIVQDSNSQSMQTQSNSGSSGSSGGSAAIPSLKHQPQGPAFSWRPDDPCPRRPPGHRLRSRTIIPKCPRSYNRGLAYQSRD